MSGVNSSQLRPMGRTLVVASPQARAEPSGVMQRLGYSCAEFDEPYSAAAELFSKPQLYCAILLSLNGLYREELALIEAIKRRLPHIEVWLSHTDGRQSAMAEAIRLGADGILADEALHRMGSGVPPATEAADVSPPMPAPVEAEAASRDPSGPEPVLTAEELRALLAEEPRQ